MSEPLILTFSAKIAQAVARDEVTLEDSPAHPVGDARPGPQVDRTRATDVKRETLDDD